MPSLKSINAEAGTNFRRWKEVTAMATESQRRIKEQVDAEKARHG